MSRKTPIWKKNSNGRKPSRKRCSSRLTEQIHRITVNLKMKTICLKTRAEIIAAGRAADRQMKVAAMEQEVGQVQEKEKMAKTLGEIRIYQNCQLSYAALPKAK